MDVELFSLSEYASLGDGEGKLTIAGIFDTLYSDKLPIKYPIFYISSRIKFNADEVKSYRVKVKINDSKNEQIGSPITGEVDVKKSINNKPSSLNLVIKYENLELPKEDEYNIQLYLNDKLIKSIILYAILT